LQLNGELAGKLGGEVTRRRQRVVFELVASLPWGAWSEFVYARKGGVEEVKDRGWLW